MRRSVITGVSGLLDPGDPAAEPARSAAARIASRRFPKVE